MCCIRGICILAPGANVGANMIFHPVTDNLYPTDKSTLPSVRFEPSVSCYLRSDSCYLGAMSCHAGSASYSTCASVLLVSALARTSAVDVHGQSDGPIDRSDPSDKAVYGWTIFYRWIYSNPLRTKISLWSLKIAEVGNVNKA